MGFTAEISADKGAIRLCSRVGGTPLSYHVSSGLASVDRETLPTREIISRIASQSLQVFRSTIVHPFLNS